MRVVIKSRLSSLITTLRGRLALLVCLVTLPALLFTVFVANNERGAVLKRMEEDAYHLARLASREHAHQIGGGRTLLRWIGDRLMQDGNKALVMADEEFLPALLVGYPQLANIGVLSPDGKVLRSAYPMLNFPDMWDNPAVQRALKSNEVETGKYILGPIVGRPVLNLAYAVRKPGGAVQVVVFVALDLRWLKSLAEQVNLPPGYSLLIIDRDGHVLAQSGVGSVEIATGQLIPGISALANQPGGKLLKVSENSEPQFFVAAQMDEIPGISVAVELPYKQIYRKANLAFYRALAGLALLTLFAAGSALAATELSILRSLRTLSHTAQRFGAGDLSARAIVGNAHGELHDLAMEFNAMANSLAVRHAEVTEAHKKLQVLSHHFQVVRETEAKDIARELHDEIGQVLTSLKIRLAGLRRRCLREGAPCQGTSAFEQDSAEMSKGIDRAVDFVRQISSELRPTVLDRLGLAAAIESYSRELEAGTELSFEINIRGIDESIDWLISITVFRIAQETLTNIVRHAGATLVHLDLTGTTDEIVLSVNDDGKGINPDEINRINSIGIIGMRERSALVNGTFIIHGEPGRGTTVTVRIPRKRAEEDIHAHPIG